MISALEPLAALPGVHLVMMVTQEGIPIAMPGKAQTEAPSTENDEDGFAPEFGALGREDALAALATGWLAEINQAVAPLSWTAPQRVLLKAARGTLVLQKTRGAVLLVVLAKGLDPEEIRLSMDGTVARIERSLRNMGGEEVPATPSDTEAVGGIEASASTEPPGPLPTGEKDIPENDLADHGQRPRPSGN